MQFLEFIFNHFIEFLVFVVIITWAIKEIIDKIKE